MTAAEIITELGPQGIGRESIANALDALVRVRVITDDVAQTNEIGALIFARIR